MNQEINIKEYTDKLGNIKLSASARARMHENLLEYARFNDVRVKADSRSIQQVPLRTSIRNILNFKLSHMTLAILIAIMLSGGTSYAAESAIPGDFLYSVKVGVNENVKSAFAVSDEAEAKLQAHLAEERLEEAEELAARGELTSEVSADISARLKTHYDDAEARNKKTEAAGNYSSSATVRASLEGTFRSYAEILTQLNANVAGNDGSALILNVRTYADLSAQSQNQATNTIEASVNAKADTESALEQAGTLIATVQTKLSRSKNVVAASVQTNLEARLNEAVEAEAKARAALQTNTYAAAYGSVQVAIRLAAEVETMIDSALRIQAIGDVTGDGALDAVINGSLDLKGTTGTDSNSTATPSMGTTSTSSGGTSSSSAGAGVDASIDATLDTDQLDVEIRSDNAVNSSLSL